MTNRRSTTLAGALLGALLLFAPEAFAQRPGVTLDQFRTAETVDDGFAISRPNDRGHLKFGASLTVDYANDPLVVETRVGDSSTETSSIVEHHLVGALSLSLGIADRLVIFGGLPVTLWMDGETTAFVPEADDAGVGDPWVGARLRLIGENEDVFGLGLQAHVTFPLAKGSDDEQAYRGERGVSFQPELSMELRPGGGVVLITANAGVQLRREATFGTDVNTLLTVGNEVRYGLGITIPVARKALTLHAELYGATPLGDVGEGASFGDREGSPLEALGGLKYHSKGGFSVGAAAGPGIVRGYGSPDLRVIGQLGFAAPIDEEEEIEQGPGDADADGIVDDQDACPEEPEDIDAFEDEDGCPDPDNDGDGVLDMNDGAPMDPEDADGFEDEDGVPDPDNDGDNIADADDQCPVDAEDVDTFEDEDGCPDLDNDKDGVPDVEDACPLAPGKPSENQEQNGCPKSVRVDAESGQIVILKRVEFATGKDKILRRSIPILEEVQATIAANPQLKLLRVEGHTDSRGRDKSNMRLSKKRATSVKTWLIENGIDASRLEAYGCGESNPIDSNSTRQGRQQNRRVEFHILVPAPASGARSDEGCQSGDEQ